MKKNAKVEVSGQSDHIQYPIKKNAVLISASNNQKEEK